MIADPWLRWVLVALFVFSAGYCAWRLLRPGIWKGKIAHVFHLLMCVSMLAMVVPGTPTVPYPAQVVVFGVGTVWFALLALGSRSRYQGATGFACASGRVAVWYHTAMMAAMLWMVAVMGGWLVGGVQHAATASGSGGMAGMDMPGMDMPGMSMDAMAPSPAEPAAPTWIVLVDAVVGVLFLAAALWWLRRYFAQRKNSGRSGLAEAELLCEVAMALGMGVVTLAMA